MHLKTENIFVGGNLMTSGEMNAFVDSFRNDHVPVHFDTGNIMFFQFPQDCIPQLGKRKPREALALRHANQASAAFLTILMPHRGTDPPRIQAALADDVVVGADQAPLTVGAMGRT